MAWDRGRPGPPAGAFAQAHGQAIDTAAKALSEVLSAFAADTARLERGSRSSGWSRWRATPILKTVAPRCCWRCCSMATGKPIKRSPCSSQCRAGDALIAQVRDIQVRILTDEKRLDEAYALSWNAASAPGATIGDFSRLGDVLHSMKRYPESADYYGRAIVLAQAQGLKDELWPLLLLQASSLEEGKRWPEARAALNRASQSRRGSRCCSTSWAMPSSSAARTWIRPRR